MPTRATPDTLEGARRTKRSEKPAAPWRVRASRRPVDGLSAASQRLSRIARRLGSFLRPKSSDRPGTPRGRGPLDLLLCQDFLIPVEGVDVEKLRDSFLSQRGRYAQHLAIDIGAPRGTPVLATTDGQIVRLRREKRGGISIYQKDATGKYLLFYCHLSRYAEDCEARQAGPQGRRDRLRRRDGTRDRRIRTCTSRSPACPKTTTTSRPASRSTPTCCSSPASANRRSARSAGSTPRRRDPAPALRSRGARLLPSGRLLAPRPGQDAARRCGRRRRRKSRSSQRFVSFSETVFWRRRAARLPQSISSNFWSWLKQEKTISFSAPVSRVHVASGGTARRPLSSCTASAS